MAMLIINAKGLCKVADPSTVSIYMYDSYYYINDRLQFHIADVPC